MSAVTPAMVKELRDKTSVSMSECKKALEEAQGDMEAAVRVLRERGIAKAAKRGDRVASEGVIAVAIGDGCKTAVMAQLNSETDFAARNEEFTTLVAKVAAAGLAAGATTMDELMAAKLADGRTVQLGVDDIRTKIGEKIDLTTYNTASGDVVAGYVHPPGKIGVLISASAPGIAADKVDAVAAVLKDVAMHVAAFAPRFLNATSVDPATIEQEREIAAVQARNEGKPEAKIPMIVEGKVKAFLKDSCLVDQPFARDPSKSVTQIVNEAGKAAGVTVTLTGFTRVQIGGA